ncbi:hypothetical protein HMPREF9141_0973 [Prevotella multiformis DSM 16608]|uniref:Uncharacterized protein n=1 Tax=Prevotella multiformis DSM 16608 TaxID=888743 RepID=F0F5V7_9BACT|nr:hypothetical protein HMPREF9141_0973 [Prevotella multiformis DSM 16608]
MEAAGYGCRQSLQTVADGHNQLPSPLFFLLFLHKAYLCAHDYKVSVLKYFKIGAAYLSFYFPFYYLCMIEQK